MISLDNLNEIVLEVTGNDFTKAQIKAPDGRAVDTVCQGASLHVRAGDVTKIEVIYFYEADGEAHTKSLWFTIEDADFKVKAWRDLHQPNELIHLPKLISDRLGVSSSEGRRLLAQGAVKINNEVVRHLDRPRASMENAIVQVGNRRHFEMGEEP